MIHEGSTDDLSRQLAAQLAGRDGSSAVGASSLSTDPYRVDEVLKRSASEVTEVVYFEGQAGGELGPFVRKRFLHADGADGADPAGMPVPCGAYDAIWRAQRSGRRFAHLPRVIDIREAAGEASVVTEFVPGETLAALVARRGGSARLALQVMPIVCDAVRELHEGFDTPIIHRDLKPSNIMVAGADRDLGAAVPAVTIIDFGIARCWKPGAQADTTHFGTRSYAPPEQFGFGQTNVRSDVYALGMLLFFCCTGLEPRPGLDAHALGAAGVPDALAGVILRATAFDPAGRYASAADMGRALRSVSIADTPAGEGALAEVEPDTALASGEAASRAEREVRLESTASDVSAAVADMLAGEGVPSGASPSSARAAYGAARRAGHGERLGSSDSDASSAQSASSAAGGSARRARAENDGRRQGVASDTSVDLPAAYTADGPVNRVESEAHPEDATLGAPVILPGVGPMSAGSGGGGSACVTPEPDTPPTMAIVPYSQCPRLPQVPRAVGIVWNILLLGFASLIVAGCWYAIFKPNAHDAGQMLWFRVLEYGIVVAVPVIGTSYFLSDRRRLMGCVPVLRNIPADRGIAASVRVAAAAFLVTAIIGGVLGYF